MWVWVAVLVGCGILTTPESTCGDTGTSTVQIEILGVGDVPLTDADGEVVTDDGMACSHGARDWVCGFESDVVLVARFDGYVEETIEREASEDPERCNTHAVLEPARLTPL